MNVERWERLEAIICDALDRPEGERMTFLAAACDGDLDLQREATSLLRRHDPAFLETPVVSVAELSPLEADTDGAKVGPYRVVRPLGRGGMGEVLLAVGGGEDFRQSVAVKLVREGVDTDDILRRFRGERRILASLNHPNIARMLDGGATESGRPYFVMEYVDGVPVDEYCDRERLSVSDRLRLFGQICDAVQHAHRNLIVHRDIKPSNILVTNDGIPKLLDFGISKVLDATTEADLASPTTRVYTPRYASPEQVTGEPVTTATDVFSLGVVLYELLSSVHPYDGAPDKATGPQTVARVPPPSAAVRQITSAGNDDVGFAERRGTTATRIRRELTGDLDRIVMKAIHREPQRRYASPGAMAEDLERYLGGRPILARPDSLAYRARRFVHRNPWAGVAGVFGILAIVSAIVFPWTSARQMEVERDRALEVQGFLLEIFGASGAGNERGDTLTAGGLLDRQAAVLESEYGDRPEVHAAMSLVLAEGYERLGLYADAVEHASMAVGLYREVRDEDDPDLASALNLLGWTQFRVGAIDEGERHLRQAVAIRRRLGTRRRRDLARSLNDLGVLVETSGRFDSATAMHSEAMKIRTEEYGPEHRATAVSANNLASLYYRKGEYAEAARLAEFAKSALEGALGPDHQRTVVATNNLAAIRAAAGDLAGSRDTYLELLERQTRLQGRSHPVTLGVMTSAATVMRRLGQPDEAEELLKEALGHYEQQFGPVHERVGSTLQSLALVRAQKAGMAEASPLFARAVTVMSEVHGPTNTAVANVYVSWGGAWRSEREFDRAAAAFARAFEINRDALGPDHFRTVDARIRLAHALRRARRWEDAVAQYDPLLQTLAASENLERLNDVRVGWATVTLALGDTARADSIVRVVREYVDGGQAPTTLVRFLESAERSLGRGAPPPDSIGSRASERP